MNALRIALLIGIVTAAPAAAQNTTRDKEVERATASEASQVEVVRNALELAKDSRHYFVLSKETDQVVMGANIAFSLHYHFAVVVGEKREDGGTPLTFTTKRATGILDVPTAGLKDIRFDTAEKDRPKPTIALPQFRQAVDGVYAAIDRSFLVVLDKSGAVVEVKNLDPSAKESALPGGGLESWQSLLPAIPASGVAVGKDWSVTRNDKTAIFATTTEEKYVLESADEKSIKVTMTATPKLEKDTPQPHPYAKMFNLGPASVASKIEISRRDGLLNFHTRTSTAPLVSKTPGAGAGQAIAFSATNTLRRVAALPKPVAKPEKAPLESEKKN